MKETARRAYILRLAALILALCLLASCANFGADAGTSAQTESERTPETTLKVETDEKTDAPGSDTEATRAPETTSAPETSAAPGTTVLPETTKSPETTDEPLPDGFLGLDVKIPSLSASPIEYSAYGKSAFLLDLSENSFLYLKGDGNARLYPASITKLITALVALEYCEPDELFTVGEERTYVIWDSSVAGLVRGDVLSLYDLLHALLLPSGGDAAYTIAANVGRVISGDPKITTGQAAMRFVEEMNAFAKKLGMENTNFTAPDGYHNDNHYSTLYDICLLAISAYNNPTVREVTSKLTYSCRTVGGRSFTWRSSNKLLDKSSPYYFDAVDGLKTGTTDEAGCCMIATAKIGDKYYMSATFGAGTTAQRFSDCVALLVKARDR